MELIKVEGIILKETNYSESSKILNVLTKELGLISIMSKGCRNIKSKFLGISNRLVYANFYIYYKKNGISTLKDADIIDTLKNIRLNIENISYAAYLLDLTDQVYKHSKSNDIFSLLISILKKLDEGYDPFVLTCIYELKLLDYLGIKPNVDECCICGNTKNILTISIQDGGFICQNCYHGGKIYSEQIIKLIRLLIHVDVDNITKISIKDSTKKELTLFIEEYYDTLSGVYLKSKDFLKNLKILENKGSVKYE